MAGGFILLATCVFLQAAAHSPAARALTNCTTSEAGVTPEEQNMLSLFNGARAAAGVGPLKFSPTLNRAAAWKSADPSALPPAFSHTDSLGRDPFTRMADCGYPPSYQGENIAYGSTSSQAIFDLWMGSPGHRANILSANYTVAGIGQHGTAWTADFGSVDDSGSGGSPTNTPTPTSTNTPTPTHTPTQPGSPTPTGTSTPTSTPTPTSTSTPTPTNTPTSTPTPPGGVHLALFAGLNLVTYAGPEATPATAFASLVDALIDAYRWDAATFRWDHFAPRTPAYAQSISRLKAGDALFIHLSRDATWSY